MRLIRLKALLAALLSLAALAPADPASLRTRNYYVRIAIAPAARCIAIRPTASYRVIDSAGTAVGTISPGEIYFLTLAKSAEKGAAKRVFRIVLREFESTHQTETAVTVASAAEQAYGIPAKTLRIPAKDGKDGGLMVTIGEFKSMYDAQEYRRKLRGLHAGRIFEDKGAPREGRISLDSRSGSRIASDAASLRLVPGDLSRDSLYLTRASGPSEFEIGTLKGERHYRGNVVVSVNREGTLTAVNHVWIEQYIYGVVAAEMGNFAPFEALKAQSVAARSEAVAKFERGITSSDPLYDFDDSSMIQTYKGMGEENAEVRRAVDATRGEVLVWNNQPIDAVYSHSCGGVISSLTDQWGGRRQDYSVRIADRLYGREVGDLSTEDAARAWTARSQDTFCNPLNQGFPNYAKKSYRWTKSWSGADLERLFNVGKVREIAVEKRSGSGRVLRLRVKGDRRSVVLSKEMDIRGALGDIKSTFFTFDLERGADGSVARLEVRGAGFGHGVGMCQMGAYVMALKGYEYRQILGFYYVKVKIRKLYD